MGQRWRIFIVLLLYNISSLLYCSVFQISDGPHASESESLSPAPFYPSYNSEASDVRIGGSIRSLDHIGSSDMIFDGVKMESASQISSPMHSCPGSFREWCSPFSKDQGERRVGVLQSEIPSCSTASSFADEGVNRVLDNTGVLGINLLLRETGAQFGHMGGKNDSKGMQTLHFLKISVDYYCCCCYFIIVLLIFFLR